MNMNWKLAYRYAGWAVTLANGMLSFTYGCLPLMLLHMTVVAKGELAR